MAVAIAVQEGIVTLDPHLPVIFICTAFRFPSPDYFVLWLRADSGPSKKAALDEASELDNILMAPRGTILRKPKLQAFLSANPSFRANLGKITHSNNCRFNFFRALVADRTIQYPYRTARYS